MHHATRDGASKLSSLLRALTLGGVLVVFGGMEAGAQFTERDPYAPDASGVPSVEGRGIGLEIPKRSRSELPRSISDVSEERAEGPFTLDEPLVKVKIEGNTTIPNSEIGKHIKTRPGRTVTAKQIKDDVDALVRTRWFASVEPAIRRTDEGNMLVFRVLERPIVRRVEYKGNNKIKTKTFDAMTQLKPGQPYDVSVNRECARRIEEYYREKGFAFATVELERGDDRNDPDREVVFLINEGPKVHVSSVKFDGNKAFYDQLLKTKTRTKTRILWLFGGKYDPSTISDDVDGVRQYYYSLGYFDVQIKPRLEYSEDKSKVEIHYEIDEGVRYRIQEISFAGNKILPDETIQSLMTVEAGVEYNARHIAKDVEAIREKYGEQGRLFARVDAVPRWTEEPGIVDIVYRIDEDKVYRVRNIGVHIAGDYPHTRSNLIRNISPIHPGDLADPKKIQLLKTRLAGSQYFETGADGGPRIETNIVKNNDWVKAPDMDVARGQNVGRRDNNAGRVAEMPAGRPASATSRPTATDARSPRVEEPYLYEFAPPPEEHRLQDDSARLAPLTPVFRGQSRDPLKPPENPIYDVSPQGDPFGKAIQNPDPYDWDRMPPPEFIDIDTYLSEARTGRLMFGVGVNSNSGVIGNIVLSEQNFDILRPPTSWDDVWNGTAWRGAGQKFRIEAMPGTQLSRYLVDWSDPYFLDTNNSLGVSGFYFNRYYLNWTEQRLGGRVRVGRQLTQQWSGSVALRLEGVDVFNPSTSDPPKILKDSLGSSLLSTVQGSVMHDTRDAAFMPSQGHYVELGVEQAFNDYTYSRLTAEGRQYFTTYQRADGGGKHIVSVRGEIGWTGSDTPIFERFYAGGFQSFRGFYFRGVSPREKNVYIGGDWMALGSVEYQLPVLANEMVKVVAFSDFGTVTDKISLDDFRLSVGAGLRISVPMMGPVPIALDWAVPILKEQSDKTQMFSFYIGVNR